jgi:nitronate monooxygenase
LMGAFSLIPQVVDRVSTPVVANGGIADARGIKAAFALGAEGAQIGTAFLACEESGASALHRAAVLGGAASKTALTRGFTGRLARGVKNKLLDLMSGPDVKVLPYPLQRNLVRHITSLAETANRPDLVPLWSGQSANLVRFTSAREFPVAMIFEMSAST